MDTQSLQAIVPTRGWKDRSLDLQVRDKILPFRSLDDGNTGMRVGDKKALSLGWKARHMTVHDDYENGRYLPSTDSQRTDIHDEYVTPCDDEIDSGASSASFQCDLQSSVNSLPQDEAWSIPNVSSKPNPVLNPHVWVNVSQVRIRSVDYSQSSIQSVTTSEVSVQQIVTASTLTQVRPLPPTPVERQCSTIQVDTSGDHRGILSVSTQLRSLPLTPAECHSKRTKVDASEDCCSILSCCNRRKYYKVGNTSLGRNNMAWMLRKKTLLGFSTLSMVLTLMSCGMLLVLQFWEHLVRRDEHTCVGRQTEIVTAGDLKNRTEIDCQSQIQQVLENLTVPGNDKVSLDKACSVNVQKDGWFFIYSSVRVSIGECPPPMKQWQHKIVLVTRNQTTTNQTLAMAVRTCCVDCPEYNETSFTGAIYRLEKGDQLTVFLDLPNTASNQTCIDTITIG